MGSLVFIAPEPHPDVDAGRSIHHLLRAVPAADFGRLIACLVDWLPSDTAALSAAFPGLRVISIDTLDEQDRFVQHPPARAYSTSVEQWRSAVIFRSLAALNETTAIEYVEFPDRGGLAFCTLQERNLRNFLGEATIAVRLCSSWTQLLDAEAQVVDGRRLNLSDLERKCLRDCDRVIAAVPSVAEATRVAFAFPAEEWNARVVMHAIPPNSRPSDSVIVSASSDQSLVFPAKLQRSQRPDLFVRAAAEFLNIAPAFTGSVLLGMPALDEDYAVDVERLIPAAHASRFSRMPEQQGPARDAVLRGATVVIASSWDDFCPTAYEASSLGARLILNETNPAFGVETPWRDGVNCLKFDGSVRGSADALKRNFERNESLQPVQFPVTPWPWTLPGASRPPWRTPTDLPLVSVVVAHFNLGAYLAETLASVRAQSYGAIEIVVVDDASSDPQSVLAIDGLESASGHNLRIVRLPGNVGLAAARNIGVRHARGRYVLTLDADDLIHPEFIALGVEALENRAEFDVLVTPAGYFLDGDPLPDSRAPVDFIDYAMFTGEAVLGGLLENRFSTATALFRKSILERFPYLESLSCYEDWSLYMRMCDAGVRFIVSNDVLFYYRRRRNSMVHSQRHPERKRIEYSDLMRTSAPAAFARQSRHLVIGIASPVAVIPSLEPTVPAMEPESEEAVDKTSTIKGAFGAEGKYDAQVAFAALKLSRWAERKVPWLVGASLWLSSRAWRAYRAIRHR
ncbi:glycosyltransferase family 2 protein [Variovorax ureilyticus]|uniref:glycosyltransferase family 2 protein n=1 Tax=Variovorax ureilyticus TaxID=1836198 RepID=UPI003D6679D0